MFSMFTPLHCQTSLLTLEIHNSELLLIKKKSTEDKVVNIFFRLNWGSNWDHAFKHLSFHEAAFHSELCRSGQALFILTLLHKTFIVIMLIFVMWAHFKWWGFFPIFSTASITPQFLTKLNLKPFKFIISTSKDDYLALSKQP